MSVCVVSESCCYAQFALCFTVKPPNYHHKSVLFRTAFGVKADQSILGTLVYAAKVPCGAYSMHQEPSRLLRDTQVAM